MSRQEQKERGKLPNMSAVTQQTYAEIERDGKGYLEGRAGGEGKFQKGKEIILVPMTQEEYNIMKTLGSYELVSLFMFQAHQHRECLRVRFSGDAGLSDKAPGVIRVPIEVIEKITPNPSKEN